MQLKTLLLVCIGFIFLGLGAVGLLLPVWPTTPFVLVSAACFSSTPRLRRLLTNISFFREHIENYEHRNGLSPRTQVITLSYLWGMLLLSMILIRNPWVILLLMMIGIAVTIHVNIMSKAKEKSEVKE